MNSWELSFGPEVLWPVITALGMLALLVVREWLKPVTTKRKLINSLVSGLAIVALLMIWVQPNVISTKRSQPVLLLTQGYDLAQKDSLALAHSFIKVRHYDSLSFVEANEVLHNYQVYMLGNGLPEEDLTLWKDFSIDYVSPDTVLGLTRLKYDEHGKVGEELEVSGLYNSKSKGKLRLEAFGKLLDSVEISMGEQPFELSTLLKNAGRYVYALSFENATGVASEIGQLPVQVGKAPRLRILMLNSFPTFEQKYLKNFLAREGHQLTVRNQLSKGRYQFEFHNIAKEQRFYRLTGPVLDDINIVIIDFNTFKQLGKKDLNELRNHVEMGLGLLVLPAESQFKDKKVDLLRDFEFTISGNDYKILTVHHKKIKVPTYGYTINPSKFQRTRIGSLLAYESVGVGKVATNTFRQTYQLVLNGQDEAYQWLWKNQLDALAFTLKGPLVDGNRPLFTKRPFHFILKGFNEVAEVKIDSANIPMAQDPYMPTHWSGVFWPTTAGWHGINVNQSDTLWVYVQQDDAAWQSLVQARQIKANSRFFALKSTDAEGAQQLRATEPVNPWWFYLMFLISVAYLWLEPKIL